MQWPVNLSTVIHGRLTVYAGYVRSRLGGQGLLVVAMLVLAVISLYAQKQWTADHMWKSVWVPAWVTTGGVFVRGHWEEVLIAPKEWGHNIPASSPPPPGQDEER